ncbi:hypothetical protein [Pseudobutyrivibrio ruminis]|uniref:Uncharacterized protein n=1 Tax=Pseudobutyrivibrio ruminis DSM 9787 TaxID=1123011 RepID=A0A285RQ76_9FIRM|nr:hypothetical protein [Pseudobutyrivibrio ruminis]SOB96255.1 hypothetical protein SAMN02910411_1020 [Pseudobutyrivibrio ruminis DSM 9787]
MKSEKLLFAMKGIDDDIISKTYKYSTKRKIVSFRKNFLVAACICLIIIGTGVLGYNQGLFNTLSPNKNQNGVQSQITLDLTNSFSLKVYAAENKEIPLEAGKEIPISIGNIGNCWGFSEGGGEYDENGEVIYYHFDLPKMDCEGNNIKDISFSINKSQLQVTNYIVDSDGKPVDGTCDSNDTYTFSYDEFKNNYINISVIGYIPKNDTAMNAIFTPETIDEYLNQVKNILEGIIITCQVTYNDGSTDSINIIMDAAYMTYDELKNNFGIEWSINPEDKLRSEGTVEVFYKVKE